MKGFPFTEADLALHLEKMRRCNKAASPPPNLKEFIEEVNVLNQTHVQIILPFKLPTWNQLLAMDHWQRRKVREWIKERVSECIQSGIVLPTQMGSARKLLLTDSSRLEYSEMIQPNSSKKCRIAKKLAKLKKP